MKRNALRAGIVGFCCQTGLGYATWDFYRHLPFASWLVIEHPELSVEHRRLDRRCRVYPSSAGEDGEAWLCDLDVVFSIEREFVPGLWRAAKQRGIRIVFMPNAEWFDPADPQMTLVDTFIAPTRACAAMLEQMGFGGKTRYIPHPVDVTRFAFRERQRAHTFVHFRGWGGYRERKGTGVVLQAALRCPDTPFVIRCQRFPQESWPGNVRVTGPTAGPRAQYTLGDVAIQPSRWEGVGLSILEAMACGLPVIVPDAPPMNEYPADRDLLVPARATRVKLARAWTAWETDPAALAETVRALHGRRIAGMSRRARAQMEKRSWQRLQSEFLKVLSTEC